MLINGCQSLAATAIIGYTEFCLDMLRPYQSEMIQNLRASMQAHQRVLGVLPTGRGKTRIFCEIASMARARGYTVKVLVHRRELVEQTADPSVQTIQSWICLLYTSPSPRDQRGSRMPSSA